MEGGCVETQPISLKETLIESIKEPLGLTFYSDEYDWLSEQATLDQLQQIAEFFEKNGESDETKAFIEQFIDGLMNGNKAIEGDGQNFNNNFWNNSPSFQQQELPSWQDFKNAYPKSPNGGKMPANQVFSLIGGNSFFSKLA